MLMANWVESTKIDYVSDKMTQHHFHVDARFSPVENYTEYEINNSDWHTIISPKSEIEYETYGVFKRNAGSKIVYWFW